MGWNINWWDSSTHEFGENVTVNQQQNEFTMYVIIVVVSNMGTSDSIDMCAISTGAIA